jgi:HlyD family secretion protein
MNIRDTSGQDRSIAKPATSRIKQIATASLVVIVVAAIVYAWPSVSRTLQADFTVSQQNLRFATVSFGDLQRDVAVQGRIIAANSPTIFAPSAGTLNLQIRAGDSVMQGQIVANIETPELSSRLSQQQAQLQQLALEIERHNIQIKTTSLNNQQRIEQALVDFEVAQVEKQRAESSIKNNLISQRELEERTAAYKRAQLAYKHALQNYDLQKESMQFEHKSKNAQHKQQALIVTELQRQVNNLQIKAPTTGIIGSVNVREKDQVAVNQALITIIDLSQFEVEVSIPETYADDLGVGLESEISFNGQLFAGEVTAISPEVSGGQVTGRIRFTEPDIKGLRQNQRVNARILIESRANVLKVKRGSFIESGGSKIAYLVNGQSAVKTDISLGVSSIGEIEVINGLEQGDKIIISSVAQFGDSEFINLTN